MNNKFTILTASSNKYPYLNDWMESILSQKYRPLEVVLVDDCSDDDTRKLIKRFRKRFEENDISFNYLKNKKRLHCSSSYRVAIKNATGDFMGVLDADDMLVDDAVEYIMSKYNEHEDIAWIYTQFAICDANMKYVKDGFCRMPTKWGSMLDSGVRRKQVYSHWRTFSRRCNNLNTVLPEGLRCAVDKYMGYKLEELGNGMFINRSCYRYRQGVKRGIVAKESTKLTWKKLVQNIVKNRNKNNIQPYPIVEGEV
jgi:glycosyltransferase involved in cell wall biosynthesis